MPYRRRQPVPEEEMIADEADMRKQRYAGHHSICQVLREIWASTDDINLRVKARLAMAMAKAMNERLKYYKDKYEPDSPTEQSGCPSLEASSSPPI